MKSKIIGIGVLLFLLSNAIYAQHEYTETKEEHHAMKGSHILTIGLGHTHVSEGEVDGKKQWINAASWSLDYHYCFSNNWAIGVQNDWVMESYIIEDKEKETLERKNPVSVVPVAMFKPGKHWGFIGGVGVEFSEGQNLMLTRLGVEYAYHIPKNWEVGAAFIWDGKWNYYNSYAFAFTVSKIWPKKHQK